MSRYKDYDATGIAPGGRLYAGDLNGIQDLKADRYNLAENLGTASIAVGEAGLILLRYGAGEARISGALRTDGIIRGLGGFLPGIFTTAQRDAIPTGFAPFGVQIINVTTGRYEWNSGTDAARSWKPLDAAPAFLIGTEAARPAATALNSGSGYYATDSSYLYVSNGSVWARVKTVGDIAKLDEVVLTTPIQVRTGSSTEASAIEIFHGVTISYDGVTTVELQIFSPAVESNANAGGQTTVFFYRDTTLIGTQAVAFTIPLFSVSIRDVPAAGNHYYRVTATNNTSTGQYWWQAGPGGSAPLLPSTMRVMRNNIV